jgi:hypothetical protein
MKKNTKSSITLPPKELELVEGLLKATGAKSKVEVIRRGLYLLKSQTDREALRAAYANASRKVAPSLREDLKDLDPLSGEGID